MIISKQNILSASHSFARHRRIQYEAIICDIDSFGSLVIFLHEHCLTSVFRVHPHSYDSLTIEVDDYIFPATSVSALKF